MGILTDLSLRLSTQTAELKKGLADASKSVKGYGKTVNNSSKTASKGFTEMKKSAGSAASSITNSLGSMSGFGPMFTALGTSMKTAFALGTTGVKSFTKAFIATGIGALVVALGTAIGALISYFKNTKKGADTFNKIMGGISAVVSTLMHRINILGEAVDLVLHGKFKQAAAKAKEAFTDIGKEMKDNYQLGRDIAEKENALIKRKNAFLTQSANLQTEIARLVDISSDKTLTLKEREEATAKAIEVQKKLSAETIAIKKDELDLLVRKNALGDNTYEDDKNEQEARREIILLRKEEYDKVRELKNRQEEITNSTLAAARAAAKLYETRKKIAEQEGLVNLDLKFESEPPENLITSVSYWDTEPMNAFFEMAKLNFAQFSITMSELNVAFMDSMNRLASVLLEGGKNFKDYGQKVGSAAKDIIGAFIAQATAALVSSAISSAASLGPIGLAMAPALAALAGGIAKTAFNSLIPSFAAGGLAYGPTLGLMGEYPTARSNPEVIAPLSDLKNMLGFNNGEVKFRIDGTELVGVLSNYNTTINNY